MFESGLIINVEKKSEKEPLIILTGHMEPVVVTEVKEKEMDVLEELEQLKARLAQLTNEVPAAVQETKKEVEAVAKNHRMVKADPNRKYVRLGSLRTFGRVPQQQTDLAKILTDAMEVGKEYTEVEVFGFIMGRAGEFEQLRQSRQHPTYLFAYYRGLKNDGKHAGFVGRGFLRQIG